MGRLRKWRSRLCCSRRALLDGPDAAARFTLSEPLVQTGEEGRSALRKRGFRLLHLLPNRVQRKTLFTYQLSGEGFLLAKQAQEEMRRADVLVVEPLRLVGAIGQHTLALVAERKIHRGRHLLAIAV